MFSSLIPLLLTQVFAGPWALDKIQSDKAWKINNGDKKVVVAIIDTGIDAKHPALRDNLWINPGEDGFDKRGHSKRNNGIDDDHNGYVDDVHGWNFSGGNNDLTDTHGHGTHIAGIIGAKKINDKLPHGVAENVSLMVLKYYDPKTGGEDNLQNSVQAILYAVRMKAQIINYSGGGSGSKCRRSCSFEIGGKTWNCRCRRRRKRKIEFRYSQILSRKLSTFEYHLGDCLGRESRGSSL